MRTIHDLVRVPDAAKSAEHDYKAVYLPTVGRLTELLSDQSKSSWRILDLGCGYHFPLVSLLHYEVGHITGVDIENVYLRDGRVKTLLLRRKNVGVLRAVKDATIRFHYYNLYYQRLSELAIRQFRFASLDLRSYDGGTLPLESGTFDAVISNAVLEHVEDVDQFVSEVSRVLRPGGWADCVWHNFYAPSGSHLGSRVAEQDPWGHLVGGAMANNLNRLKPQDIAAIFSRYLQVRAVMPMDRECRTPAHPEYEREGADQLNAWWRAKLRDYPEELLTTRAYGIQACKVV